MIMDALSASFHSKPNHVGLNNAKVISKNDFQNINLTNMILNQICILIMLNFPDIFFFTKADYSIWKLCWKYTEILPDIDIYF